MKPGIPQTTTMAYRFQRDQETTATVAFRNHHLSALDEAVSTAAERAPEARADLEAYAMLARLTRRAILGDYDPLAELPDILSSVMRLVDVDRISVWRFSDRGTSLTRFESIVRRPDTERESDDGATTRLDRERVTLYATDSPIYFRTLLRGEVIAATDLLGTKATADLYRPYLRERGVTAKLDVPLLSTGRVVGVLSFEQTRSTDPWPANVLILAVSLANLIQLGEWTAPEVKVQEPGEAQ